MINNTSQYSSSSPSIERGSQFNFWEDKSAPLTAADDDDDSAIVRMMVMIMLESMKMDHRRHCAQRTDHPPAEIRWTCVPFSYKNRGFGNNHNKNNINNINCCQV